MNTSVDKPKLIGDTNAFYTKLSSIDDLYVDGISITLGSPRKHVWTYAVGYSDDLDNKHNCPCATIPGPSPPAFVGNHYYCESGNVGAVDYAKYYLSDPLWDGSGCTSDNGCCAQIGMPWFYRKLSLPVAEDFEIRICKNENQLMKIQRLKNLSYSYIFMYSCCK